MPTVRRNRLPPLRYVIHCDGSSHQDGRGGWGAHIQLGDDYDEIYGGAVNTTNNRMELLAAIMALNYIPLHSQVTVFSDSQYVVNGISEDMEFWKQRNWRTSANKPIKNRDLWDRLDKANQEHTVDWQWLKGHAGHVGNERADRLAAAGVPIKDQL